MITNSKYELLNNKEWLTQKYVEEKLGTRVIAKLAGAKTANSARQALIKYGITVRNISDGLTVKNNDHFVLDEEVVIGSLLGDGYFVIWNSESKESYPRFEKKNIHKDHIGLVAEAIFSINPMDRIEESNGIGCTGKPCTIFSIRSFAHKELKPWYDKWYPLSSGRKKVVPRDIEITPAVLLHWFLDDGNSYRRKANGKDRRPSRQILIRLCSESFTKEDQEFLIDKMYKNFGISSSLHGVNYGTGYQIALKQTSADLFYKTIGPCPIKSMEYKWK